MGESCRNVRKFHIRFQGRRHTWLWHSHEASLDCIVLWVWLAALLAPTDLVPQKLYPEFLLAMSLKIFDMLVGVGADHGSHYIYLHSHKFQLSNSCRFLFACIYLCRIRTKGKTPVVLMCFVVWCCCCVVEEFEFFWGLVVQSFGVETCFFLVLVLLLMLLLL